MVTGKRVIVVFPLSKPFNEKSFTVKISSALPSFAPARLASRLMVSCTSPGPAFESQAWRGKLL